MSRTTPAALLAIVLLVVLLVIALAETAVAATR